MAVNLTDLGPLRDFRFITGGIVRLNHFAWL